MKKFLLSLTLLCAVFLGHSQRDLWFNEISPDPSTSTNEYIEFFNTSRTPVLLDCYVVVSYYNRGTNNEGVYIYNFPTNAQIPGLSFYLISSASPVKYKGSQTYTPPSETTFSNWNNLGTGGSISKYAYNRTSKTWGTAEPVPANFNDFMDITGGNDASLLLYKINSDGTTSLINGLFGNSDATVPANVTTLANLSIAPGSTCATGFTSVSMSFTNITANNTDVFQVRSATGNDNGYAKIGNGICGNWEKITTTGKNNNQFSPGTSNPAAVGTSTSVLGSEQNIACNGSQLNFRVTSGSSSLFNVTVTAYYDNGTIANELDVLDTPIPELTTTVAFADINKWFTLNVPNPSLPILLVYQTAQGCYSKVVRVQPETTGSLLTAEKKICGNFIDITLPGTTNASPTYVLPVTAQLFVDGNANGQLDGGEAIGAPQIITSFSSTSYRLLIPEINKTDAVLVSYTSGTSCYNKVATPVAATGTLNTTESYVCNNRLSFNISGGTTSDATTYSLPIDVMVYNEATGELMGSKTVTTYSTLADYIDLKPADWNTTAIRVEYKSSSDCFSKIVSAPPKVPTGNITLKAQLPTSKTVSYSIDNSATASDAYSFMIVVYEDRNNNGRGDADELILMQERIDAAPPANTVYTATLQDTKYNAVAEAKSIVGCSEATLILAPAKPLPVKLTSFTAKRNRGKVELTWQTAMELNNRGFEVLRKVGNSEWKVIAFVFSQADGGNSNTVLNYEFADIQPDRGASQYRLRQIDIDSRATLSDVRLVHGEEQAGKLQLFPNPSPDGIVNLVFDDRNVARTITVSDLTGRVVKQYRQVTASSLQIDNLQNGIYTLHITNATTGETTVSKFIVKKQ